LSWPVRPKKAPDQRHQVNGISISMPYWDERVAEMSREYPGIQLDKFHIDILTAHFSSSPTFFDVVVASNLLVTW
jgi:tartrate dehydrogenase/decarboxylase/D-malate dehydrogenase